MKTLGWLLSLLILCSCNNGDRLTKDVMELMGRKITFPTGYESLSYHESLSAVDFTPHWGNRSNSHAWSVVILPDGKATPFFTIWIGK